MMSNKATTKALRAQLTPLPPAEQLYFVLDTETGQSTKPGSYLQAIAKVKAWGLKSPVKTFSIARLVQSACVPTHAIEHAQRFVICDGKQADQTKSEAELDQSLKARGTGYACKFCHSWRLRKPTNSKFRLIWLERKTRGAEDLDRREAQDLASHLTSLRTIS